MAGHRQHAEIDRVIEFVQAIHITADKGAFTKNSRGDLFERDVDY